MSGPLWSVVWLDISLSLSWSEWCALGTDCQQVKDDRFPGCKFDCATECPGLLELSPVLAEDFLDNEWDQFQPAESSLPHEDNAWRPPPISPVVVDSEGKEYH